jgi:hypothetical protein
MEINTMQHVYGADALRQLSKSLPLDQDKWEVRFGMGVITGFFIGDLLRTAIYILMVKISPIAKVADLTRAPELLAGICILAALLAVPHLWALTFRPSELQKMNARRFATYGAAIAVLFWIYVAGWSMPMDIGLASIMYWAKAFGSLVIAFMYAKSINSQQNRELIENDKQAIG